MLDRLNVLSNAMMTLASGAFYLMLFTKAAPGIDAERAFGKRLYWAVKIGLSFFVAGSFFAALTMPHVNLAQFVRNLGTAVLFSWAAVYHARKWGAIVGVKAIDRQTATYRVPK